MLTGLTVILLFRLMVAIAVVPPWQHPDEPAHLARASIYAGQYRLNLAERDDHALAAVLLASMAEHGWWRAYEEQVPRPPPLHFSHPDVQQHAARQSDMSATYSLPAALYLKGLGLQDPLDQQYY